MFTVTTAEIRWFVKGDIPKTVHSWFKKHTGIYEEQPERTDVYLDIKDSGNLGIKFREGRFEVKQLINELDILTLPPQVTGKAELWKKWSFNSAESELPHADIKKGEWIEVTKTRQFEYPEIQYRVLILASFQIPGLPMLLCLRPQFRPVALEFAQGYPWHLPRHPRLMHV